MATLFEKYGDQEFAANATKEVEQIRRSADYTGYFATAAIFAGNEVARLTLRAPMFKLRPHNTVFWLVAPLYMSRYAYDNQVNDRVDTMWAIHENRVKKGMKGTIQSSGLYTQELHKQDSNISLNNGISIRKESLINGTLFNTFIDNQFHRWNTNIDKNSAHHDDIERHSLYENDNFERMKVHQVAKKDVVGATNVIPVDDNDALFHFYDQQGESIYTNPPDPNSPLIDHSLDEENVWAFRLTGYNQHAIFNEYSRDIWKAQVHNHVPFWGHKLSTPAFFSDEKYTKFKRHWRQRLGLELIKIRQWTELQEGDNQQYKDHKAEVQTYLEEVENKNIEVGMKDVYITDHNRKAEKFLTFSEEEDAMFFKYKQSLAGYKAKQAVNMMPKASKYERGSLA